MEDCNGCRLIGGGGLILAGIYIGYVGYHRAKRVGSRYGYIPSTITASLLGVMGVIRLSGHNPFSASGKSVGIDALDSFRARISKIQMEADMLKKAQQQKEQPEQMQDKQQVVEHIGQEEQGGGAKQQIQKDLNASTDTAQST